MDHLIRIKIITLCKDAAGCYSRLQNTLPVLQLEELDAKMNLRAVVLWSRVRRSIALINKKGV